MSLDLSPLPPFTWCLGQEPRWTLSDPCDKFCKSRMSAQGFDGAVRTRKVGFAKSCVDFVVTDLMKSHSLTALPATQFRHEVVQALLDVGRYWALAKRTDWIVIHKRHLV